MMWRLFFLLMLSCGSVDKEDSSASVGVLERQSISTEGNGFLTTLELSSDLFRMKIRNMTGQERILQYSPCEPRLEIFRKDGESVWSTDDIACMAIIQTSHLAPGKELELIQKINAELVKEKGAYILKAELKTDPSLPKPLIPKQMEFEIR